MATLAVSCGVGARASRQKQGVMLHLGWRPSNWTGPSAWPIATWFVDDKRIYVAGASLFEQGEVRVFRLVVCCRCVRSHWGGGCWSILLCFEWVHF